MLQGSLDDFALDEILGLLAETAKSGQLDINGDRGNGNLTFNAGKMGEARATNCDDGATVEDVMFELLRFSEGSFVFSQKETAKTGDEKNVSNVLSVAESRLADWNAIAAVVPSMGHMVRPAADLPDEEVTIDRSEWNVLTIIASGCSVEVVCDALDIGEVEGCRKIKHLIERGLLLLDGPGAATATPSTPDIPATTPLSATTTAKTEMPPLPPAFEQEPDDRRSNGDSLVASLRGGSIMGGIDKPPSALSDDGAIAVAGPSTDDDSPEGEGLLMKYLTSDED